MNEKSHTTYAIGKKRGDRLESNLGHFINLYGKHISRKAVSKPGKRVNQRLTVAAIMEQNYSIVTACCVIRKHKLP
jgi:hypothetical protein